MNFAEINKKDFQKFMKLNVINKFKTGWYTYSEYKEMLLFVEMMVSLNNKDEKVNFLSFIESFGIDDFSLNELRKSKETCVFFEKVLNIPLNEKTCELRLEEAKRENKYSRYVIKYDQLMKTLELKEMKGEKRMLNLDYLNDYQKLIYKISLFNFRLLPLKEFAESSGVNYKDPSEQELELIQLNFAQ